MICLLIYIITEIVLKAHQQPAWSCDILSVCLFVLLSRTFIRGLSTVVYLVALSQAYGSRDGTCAIKNPVTRAHFLRRAHEFYLVDTRYKSCSRVTGFFYCTCPFSASVQAWYWIASTECTKVSYEKMTHWRGLRHYHMKSNCIIVKPSETRIS